jgi:hypothetical protein
MKREQVEEILGRIAPIESEFDAVRDWLVNLVNLPGNDLESIELLNRFSKANNAFLAVKNYLTVIMQRRY